MSIVLGKALVQLEGEFPDSKLEKPWTWSKQQTFEAMGNTFKIDNNTRRSEASAWLQCIEILENKNQAFFHAAPKL